MTTKVGNNSNNTINGTSGADTLWGRGGDDTLHGLAGNDKLYGEDGDDTLYGDAGDDKLHGGNGADQLYSAAGGNDRMWGDAGDDWIVGSGEDIGWGGDGNDRLIINGGAAQGGRGDDHLEGRLYRGTATTLTGGQGDDLFDITSNDPGNAVVVIKDFDPWAGDRLSLFHFRKDFLELSGTDVLRGLDTDGDGHIGNPYEPSGAVGQASADVANNMTSLWLASDGGGNHTIEIHGTADLQDWMLA